MDSVRMYNYYIDHLKIIESYMLSNFLRTQVKQGDEDIKLHYPCMRVRKLTFNYGA